MCPSTLRYAILLAVLVLAAAAPSAAASTPPAIVKSSTMRSTATVADGKSTTVGYTDAAASTGNRVGRLQRQGDRRGRPARQRPARRGRRGRRTRSGRRHAAARLHGRAPRRVRRGDRSGQPASTCIPDPVPSNGSSLPAGVLQSHPAYSGAPAYYEVGRPTGSFAGVPARGIMLVIHGGSWTANGVGGVQAMRADADRWRARGWTTVNFTYRPCGASINDALWFYDRTRAAVGDARICALGTSAGANLALLLGAYRRDLYCAVSQAGPTDLRTIQNELAYNTATGLHDQTLGGRWVRSVGAAALGERNLARFSPAALAAGPLANTRVLQAFSADDAFVPYAQTADLAVAMRTANPAAYVHSIQLATGTIPFGHGRVTPAALNDFHAREAQLVAPVTSGPGPAADLLR